MRALLDADLEAAARRAGYLHLGPRNSVFPGKPSHWERKRHGEMAVRIV